MQNIKNILLRELKRIKRIRSIFLLLFFMPPLLIVVLSLFFNNSLVEEIPMALVNKDGSQISSIIKNYVNATQSLNFTAETTSLSQAEKLMKQGKVDGIVLIPEDFYKQIKKGKQSEITLIINAENLIKSNLIYKDILMISKRISGGVLLKKLRTKGFSEKAAMALVRPIYINTQVLYNPNFSYSTYLVPSLTIVMLQILTMLVGVLVLSREYTDKTINRLLHKADFKLTAIIIGKSLPYLAVLLIHVILYIYFFFPLFKLPTPSNSLGFFILTYILIVASFFAALGIGAVVKDPVFSTEMTIFVTTPAFIFCGITFPIMAMPQFHKILAHLVPFTYYVQGLVKVYLTGLPLGNLTLELTVIIGFAILGIVATILGTYITIRKYKLKHR